MVLYLLIALGGALGSVARFALSGLVANQIGATFSDGARWSSTSPVPFVIGFFATLTGPDGRVFASSNHAAVLHDGRLRRATPPFRPLA